MRNLVLIPSPIEFRKLFQGELSLDDQRNGIPMTQSGECQVALCGIGPAAAAFCTGSLLHQGNYERVLLLGIAGAFRESGLEIGDLVEASSECFADLGYRDASGFHTLDDMNLPMVKINDEVLGCTYPVAPFDQTLAKGPFVTVCSVTSDAQTAQLLQRQFGCVAENMEGAAVAMACAAHRVRFHQVRAISNYVGPRDPSQWQMDRALNSLRAKFWSAGFNFPR